jgi:hypothetical protein
LGEEKPFESIYQSSMIRRSVAAGCVDRIPLVHASRIPWWCPSLERREVHGETMGILGSGNILEILFFNSDILEIEWEK